MFDVAMGIRLQDVMTLLAVLGSALTVYISFHKVKENARAETEWRTLVNTDLRIIREDVKEIKLADKDSAKAIRLIEDQLLQHQNELLTIKKDMGMLWKTIETLKTNL